MTRLVIATLSAVKKLKKLDKNSIISISIGILNTPEVHMTLTGFVENFKSHTVSSRDSDQYPIEISHTIDGIKFFTITKEEIV